MTNPAEELLDIYDENDIPIGVTKTREEVHKYLVDWHRVTGVWIVTPEKKLLCQQRSHLKDTYPGDWQLTFGGHVKAGETYEENAVTELYEEVGLSVKAEDLMFVSSYHNPVQKHHAKLYIYRWNGKVEELSLNDGEVEQVKLVTLKEYQAMIDSGLNAHKINPVLQNYVDSLE